MQSPTNPGQFIVGKRIPLYFVNDLKAGSAPKKVLLVGAGGYIGRHTDVLISASSAFEVVRWNRSLHGSFIEKKAREKVIEEVEPDFLVNVAWPATNTARYEYSTIHQLWTDTSALILEECANRGIWCVLFGSGIDAEPVSPEDPPYFAAKKKLKHIFDNHAAAGVATLLSPGYVFSLSDRRPRIVKSILAQEISNEADLHRPDLALDFIEVRDVSAAVLTALRFCLAGRLVPSSGVLRTVEFFCAVVRERIGMPASAGADKTIPYWPEAAESLLASGWRPTQTDFFFNKER